MNPDGPEKDLKVSYSDNEWNYDSREWEYVYDPQDTYDYNAPIYPSGPVCKVLWVVDGKKYEKEYSSRSHAVEKQKNLLVKKIPAIIKSC